jgi:hypothetical protein
MFASLTVHVHLEQMHLPLEGGILARQLIQRLKSDLAITVAYASSCRPPGRLPG